MRSCRSDAHAHATGTKDATSHLREPRVQVLDLLIVPAQQHAAVQLPGHRAQRVVLAPLRRTTAERNSRELCEQSRSLGFPPARRADLRVVCEDDAVRDVMLRQLRAPRHRHELRQDSQRERPERPRRRRRRSRYAALRRAFAVRAAGFAVALVFSSTSSGGRLASFLGAGAGGARESRAEGAHEAWLGLHNGDRVRLLRVDDDANVGNGRARRLEQRLEHRRRNLCASKQRASSSVSAPPGWVRSIVTLTHSPLMVLRICSLRSIISAKGERSANETGRLVQSSRDQEVTSWARTDELHAALADEGTRDLAARHAPLAEYLGELMKRDTASTPGSSTQPNERGKRC